MSNGKLGFNTISAKYTHYLPDGFGRDSYIKSNNGGLLKNTQVGTKKEAFNTPRHLTMYSLKKEASAVKYRSDGTGRDSYVIDNSGGLTNEFSSNAAFHLKSILRNYEKSPSKVKVNNPNLYLTKKELMFNRNSRNYESKLVNRLYYSEILKSKKNSNNFNDLRLTNDSLNEQMRNKERADTQILQSSLEKINIHGNNKNIKLKPINCALKENKVFKTVY